MSGPSWGPRGWVRGWRMPLRLAWRDARRSRARSVLVLVMLALPVLAVTMADTVVSTSQVSSSEGVARRLGAAQAEVTIASGGRAMLQTPDPDRLSTQARRRIDRPTLEELLGALGDPDAPTTRVAEGDVRVGTSKGVADVGALEVDLGDPLARGLATLSEGRLPRSADEVVVNAALAARGPGLGDRLEVEGGGSPVVVGVVESASVVDAPVAMGPVGSLGVRTGQGTSYLVGGPTVSWAEVLDLNDLGATVASREVLLDPPSDDELPPQIRQYVSSGSATDYTVLALVVVMVLIEVVLLAGPAFAVGARRQSRNLALIAAAGGRPRDARRVVLGAGVVLGLVAAALGVVLGIVLARALLPVFQGFFADRFGPFEVVWTHLAGVAVFALVAALLAAVVPAWIASRQDVVAVLAGRRGDARASRRSPVLGAVLLAAGVAMATYGARSTASSGELLIAGSAIVCVLAMVLLVPVVVVAVGALARRFPLALRFAARDAARHRARTVPAVAAVAATVAGVVALGISVTSDGAQARDDYQPQLAQGAGVAVDYAGRGSGGVDWPSMATTIEQQLPSATVAEVRVVGASGQGVSLRAPEGRLLRGYGGPVQGTGVVVDGGTLPTYLPGLDALDDSQRAAAERVLAEGGVVAFTDRPGAVTGAGSGEVSLVVRERGKQAGPPQVRPVPYYAVAMPTFQAPTAMVIGREVATSLGTRITTSALVVSGSWSATQEQDATEAVAALSPDASFYVEHGYTDNQTTRIVQLVLGGLGAVLMLGGTLTATFLALSDARPDLATLGAVGASPRTRRGVAAAYALVVGLVGAVLGALVGLVPGIAISYPLTRPYDMGLGGGIAGSQPSHYLEIPWGLVGVVVLGLPVLTAALVWLTARSRLPMVARLD